MKIRLYSISKDINSTALPSGEAVELTGNLRVPSSVENPVIEIEAESLPDYNYAYIPAFSRYYWINNRGCSTNKLFMLSMSVDPLATFATEIGASTQYIMRAAAEYDGAITDMLYPTKNAWTEYKSEYNSPFNLDIDDCYWCVGIKGSGATNFYLFKPNGIDAFFEYLLKPGAGGYTEDALGNLSLALDSEAAVVVDPLQYISSVTCIPVDVGLSFVAGELITIGYVQDKFFYNCVKMDITSAQIATFSYTAPGHPDAARGTYLNNAPYANYYAYVPGFGKIDLDPSIVANNTITMTLRMDYRHGDCLLTISAGDAGIITRLTTSIGIPFEFSQIIAKGTSALTAANMVGGVVGNILSGNIDGVIGGATSAVKSAIENSIPSANSIGSNGSFAAITGAKVQFVARYARPVAEDNEHRGRPLCAKRKINTLSGYIMTADAHMHPEGATTAEISAIESAMNSGFYYESTAPAPSPAIIEPLTATANGTYNAPSGVDGYSPVVVNVPPTPASIEPLNITENGTYAAPSGIDGYSPVVVNVPPTPAIIKPLNITENGTYTAPSGVDGYSPVTVNVPRGVFPTGSIEITENGTFDVTNYESVNVSVPKKEDVTWHQCPQLVRDYLDNVTYDPTDYTTSQITNYAPATAAASNTKPIGKTIDGVTYYNEVPNIKTPFASTNKAGTLKPLDQVRWINSVTSNMRDLGGWNCDGGTVKYGLLYRSADINGADSNLFVKLGITKELDLTADDVPAFSGIEYINNGAAPMYALTPTTAWKDNLQAIFNAAIYRQPLVFHCAMGADRTGTLACVIEGLLGVSQSDIDKDYELTSFYYAYRARNGSYQGGATWAGLMSQITALSGETFRANCVTFALSLGFTYDDINNFRNAMIDGNPEPIVPPTTNLFDKNDPNVVLGGRINSSGNAVAYADGQLVTGFIPVTVGDVIHLATDKDNKTNSYTGMIAFYTTGKSHLRQLLAARDNWSWSDSNRNGTITVPASYDGTDLSGTAYMRICCAYTDIDSIVVTKG